MKSISFAYTTPAFLARRKTVTRREWNSGYAGQFREGDVVEATDRQARFGGKMIGTIRLTRTPYQESESLMPDEDYEGEGFAFMDEHPEHKPGRWKGVDLRKLFEESREAGEIIWVIRFEILETRFTLEEYLAQKRKAPRQARLEI